MTGLIYIFTGEGKGKTSAALGMTLRAVCDGKSVAWVAWYKTASWGVSEFSIEKYLPNVQMHVFGKGFYFDEKSQSDVREVGNVRVAKTKVGTVVDAHNASEHVQAARAALKKAEDILRDQNLEILVCDEICQAVAQQLLTHDEILGLISQRGKTHMILTGRDCPQFLIEKADTVTEMKKVKHAYDRGVMAVKGLDF